MLLVLRLVNKCGISNAAFDIDGRLSPVKGFGVVVPMAEPVHDGGFETADAIEAAAANSLAGDDCEPAFNQVQPRCAAWGEVQMNAEMGGQPLVYGKMLVGSVVVANEMQLPFGVTARQRFQESNELNMGMAREAASMHLAAGDLQRCEQAGGAVAGVVVAHAGWQSRPHRQRRLGAVKRLNLRFFIHTQHQRSLGRVEIETHDIGQFAVELRVAAEFKGMYPVRLETVLLPYAMHRGRGQAYFFGQAPNAPMGRCLRLAQGGTHYRLLLGGGDPSWPPSARSVAQTIQAMTCIASPPQTHGSLGNLEPFRQRTDALARRAAQYDPRPGCQRMCDALGSQPPLQLGSIRFADFHHPSLYAHAA